MDEKTMVSDALVGINGELKMFGDMIPQTENKELKQCLKQIRNQCEMAHFKRKISQFRVQAIKNCRLNPDPTIEPTFHKIYFSIASAAPSWRFDDVT